MNPRKYPAPRRGPRLHVAEERLENYFNGAIWLRTSQAALYIGTTEGGIRNMVYRGKLHPHKPFGRLMFKRADLDWAIEISKTKGNSNGN